MTDQRISQICQTASLLFINKGYSNTKIRDISKMTQISTGAIYSMFADKRSIFDCVIRMAADETFISKKQDFPLSRELFLDNLDMVKGLFSDTLKMLEEKKASLDYSFEQYISDVYDSLYQYGAMYLIFETDEAEYKEYIKAYKEYRMKFFKKNMEIIWGFMEKGMIRKTDDLEYTCRMIIEILTWWSMDIRYKTYEREDSVSKARIKAVCMDNLTHAYL